jgi:uncharacterized protein
MAQETALVTGASSGIGRELVRLFAAEGTKLVLVARQREKLEQLAAELREAHGVDVRVLPADLADPRSPQAIFDELAAVGVEVDVLVNNAGFGAVGAVADLPLTRQLDMLQVNVTSLTHLTRLFLPGMIARRAGGVLNVGSIAGFQPGPLMAVYYASKAYVLSFSEALCEELRGTGVRVTCLAPGATATGFAAAAEAEQTRLFRFGVMDARRVAAAGYRGFRRGKLLVIPGTMNKLLPFVERFAPRWLPRKIAMLLQRY